MTARLMDRDHFELVLAPVADFAAADPVYSDVVSLKNHNRVRFLVNWGVGTTGTIKFTINACDDVVPTNETAVPFSYRVSAQAGTIGVPTITTASAGFTNTAGSNQIVELEVSAEDLIASGYTYCRVKLDEVVDSAILGGILAQMAEPRFSNDPTTATV
jgi:hypothetical protein